MGVSHSEDANQPSPTRSAYVLPNRSINALLDILPELTLMTQETRWSTCSTHWVATIGYSTMYVQYLTSVAISSSD